MAAPSQGPDLWRLRLRAPTGQASPSPRRRAPTSPAAPSPSSELPGGGPNRWRRRRRAPTCLHPLTCRPVAAPSLWGSYLPPVGALHSLTCPYGTDARGQRHHPLACSYSTDARGQSHPSNSAHPRQKIGLCVFTAKSRAHGSISATAAGRPDSDNSANFVLQFSCEELLVQR